jgi:NADH:ubiquinone oxidoreductase subunit 4 (subunit M)
MGVLADVAAAIAIPFVLLSIWADQRPSATYQAARLSFFILTLIAGVGLIAWGFMQQSSRPLFFDYNDIVATIFGLVAAWLLFLALTPAANAAAD